MRKILSFLLVAIPLIVSGQNAARPEAYFYLTDGGCSAHKVGPLNRMLQDSTIRPVILLDEENYHTLDAFEKYVFGRDLPDSLYRSDTALCRKLFKFRDYPVRLQDGEAAPLYTAGPRVRLPKPVIKPLKVSLTDSFTIKGDVPISAIAELHTLGKPTVLNDRKYHFSYSFSGQARNQSSTHFELWQYRQIYEAYHGDSGGWAEFKRAVLPQLLEVFPAPIDINSPIQGGDGLLYVEPYFGTIEKSVKKGEDNLRIGDFHFIADPGKKLPSWHRVDETTLPPDYWPRFDAQPAMYRDTFYLPVFNEMDEGFYSRPMFAKMVKSKKGNYVFARFARPVIAFEPYSLHLWSEQAALNRFFTDTSFFIAYAPFLGSLNSPSMLRLHFADSAFRDYTKAPLDRMLAVSQLKEEYRVVYSKMGQVYLQRFDLEGWPIGTRQSLAGEGINSAILAFKDGDLLAVERNRRMVYVYKVGD